MVARGDPAALAVPLDRNNILKIKLSNVRSPTVDEARLREYLRFLTMKSSQLAPYEHFFIEFTYFLCMHEDELKARSSCSVSECLYQTCRKRG
jgi:hypothetical protein